MSFEYNPANLSTEALLLRIRYWVVLEARLKLLDDERAGPPYAHQKYIDELIKRGLNPHETSTDFPSD